MRLELVFQLFLRISVLRLIQRSAVPQRQQDGPLVLEQKPAVRLFGDLAVMFDPDQTRPFLHPACPL